MCEYFDLDTFLPEFYLTMRDLLLAELDTRMQPLIGLVEALQEYEDFSLVHHQDLIHEAIECMKAKSWPLYEKHVALLTTLELVKLQPFVSQLTR